jgi:hypothetical protein
MTPEEAQQFGVNEGERKSLVRLDGAKANLNPHAKDATWFRLVGVALDNGTDLYPNGDNVQTVERWHPPETWEGLSSDLLNRVLDDIEAGCPDGLSRYSSAPKAGENRAAWRVVVKHAPDKTEKQCRDVITAWIKSGLLYAEEYPDGADRKPRQGLRVNATKRPS